MSRYIQFDIELMDDLIMGDFAGQTELAHSFNYIAGSAIRGAIIYKLLNKKIYNSNELLEKIISNKVYFLNAYKASEDKRSIPTPSCFLADKIKQRKLENTTVINMLNSCVNNSDEQQVRLKVGDFININNGEISKVNINKNDALHIKTQKRVKKENEEKTQMYRFETIEKNQLFKSYIHVIDELQEKAILEVIKENEILYLGASKGNGYGKCKIKNITVVKENPECDTSIFQQNFNGTFYIYYLSDMIYKDKYGTINNSIEEEVINKALGIECKLEGCAVDGKVISGFNSTIGGNLCQSVAVKMGSIFKYSYTGELETRKIIDFTNKSFGERVEEGFG